VIPCGSAIAWSTRWCAVAALADAPAAQPVAGDLELPGPQDRPLAQPALHVRPQRAGALHHPWPARPQGLGGATCADPAQSPCVCEAATWEAPPPPAATLRPSPPACTATWPAIPRPPRPLGSTGRQRRLAWYGPGGSSAGRGHRPPESSLAVDAPLPRTCPSRVLSSGGPTALLDHYALEDAREQR
jgi:hypothetical protein